MPPVSPARISLPDRYRVVRHLASGGMAAVWEAHDELLDRDVAVKILAPHLGEDERARRRFQREARAAAGLSSHPHVVTIYDVGEHAGRVFMVMEIMRGGTLGDRLKSGRGIPHATAVRWLREAAEALDTAEDAGVVHRDIKPGNLLLDGQDRLAVADFGIARLAWEDQLTATGQVLGTAAYISPEQAMGEPASAASDRYSLAVVAYELLTGARPFEGSHFAAQARAHVEDPPPPPSSRASDLSTAVDAVLERALAKEPRDRYGSSAGFAAALERALTAPQTAKTRRLGRRGAAGAGAAATAGAAAGGDQAARAAAGGDQAARAAAGGDQAARAAAGGDQAARAAAGGDQPGRAAAGEDQAGRAAAAGEAARGAVGGDWAEPEVAGGGPAGRGGGGREAAAGGGWGARSDRGSRRGAAEPPRRRGSAALLVGISALLVLAVAGIVALVSGGGNGADRRAQSSTTPAAKATRTATPDKTATATATAKATDTPAPTATATGTPASSGTPNLSEARSLQLAGYNARRSGDFPTALEKARAALAACGETHQLDPCGYALFEEGVALNRSGDPAAAIPVLQKRLDSYGDSSSREVRKELKDAQARAGGKPGKGQNKNQNGGSGGD